MLGTLGGGGGYTFTINGFKVVTLPDPDRPGAAHVRYDLFDRDDGPRLAAAITWSELERRGVLNDMPAAPALAPPPAGSTVASGRL